LARIRSRRGTPRRRNDVGRRRRAGQSIGTLFEFSTSSARTSFTAMARGHRLPTVGFGATMNFAHVLFGFSGRINRAKYWLAALFWFLVAIAAFGVVIFLIGVGASDFSADDIGGVIAAFGLGILVIAIVLIAMLISYFAVGIKRLHDRNKSGWWILLFYAGPLVLNVIGGSSQSDVVSSFLALASFAITIWALVELGFLRGTVGLNQYGPDPLATEQAAVVR
jgi:uncharacterized membrane protein YhaH (DUF805 family)